MKSSVCSIDPPLSVALLLHQDLSIDKPGVVLFSPPSEEADPKALRVPCSPSKPGEQY